MIDFKGFKELDIRFSSSVMFVATLMPFWYISFILFKKDFLIQYSSLDVWIFSFCLSTVWHISSLLIEFNINWNDKEIESSKRKSLLQIHFINGGIYSIIILSMGILAMYIISIYSEKKVTYNSFLFISYSILTVRFAHFKFNKAFDEIYNYFESRKSKK